MRRFLNCLFYSLILLTSVGHAQKSQESSGLIFDTLHYNEKWQLCDPEESFLYRIAHYNPERLIFSGAFEDNLGNGSLVSKGSYDSTGKKSGEFFRYYDFGALSEHGFYKDNVMAGIWEFYYPNGQLMEKVRADENEFMMLESFDSLGNPEVVNGEGIWTKQIEVSGHGICTLVGNFQTGVKDGKWKVITDQGKTAIQEKYSKGKFISGWSKGSSYSRNHYKPMLEVNYYHGEYDQIEKFYLKPKPVHPDSLMVIEETPSSFPGGMTEFYKYIGENIKLPQSVRQGKVEGRVYVQYTVDVDGSIIDVVVISGIQDQECRDEAIRLMENCPPWKPGLQHGKPVQQRMVLPIIFRP